MFEEIFSVYERMIDNHFFFIEVQPEGEEKKRIFLSCFFPYIVYIYINHI